MSFINEFQFKAVCDSSTNILIDNEQNAHGETSYRVLLAYDVIVNSKTPYYIVCQIDKCKYIACIAKQSGVPLDVVREIFEKNADECLFPDYVTYNLSEFVSEENADEFYERSHALQMALSLDQIKKHKEISFGDYYAKIVLEWLNETGERLEKYLDAYPLFAENREKYYQQLNVTLDMMLNNMMLPCVKQSDNSTNKVERSSCPSDKGYLYVLINPSIPNLVKIGKTTRTPEARALEISQGTGVPTPFIVAYKTLVNDCSKGERFVHNYFETTGHRINSNREFFDISTTEAIEVIMKYKESEQECLSGNDIALSTIKNNIEILKQDFGLNELTIGINYYNGENGVFQDEDEALVHFQKAAEMGDQKAYWWLGIVYENKNKPKSAMKYYKIGVDKGDSSLYRDLCRIYLEYDSTRNFHNADICINRYIDYLENKLVNFQETNFWEEIRGPLYSYMEQQNAKIWGTTIERIKSHEAEIINGIKKRVESNEATFIEIAESKVLDTYLKVMFEKEYSDGEYFFVPDFNDDVNNVYMGLIDDENTETVLTMVKNRLRIANDISDEGLIKEVNNHENGKEPNKKSFWQKIFG